MYTNRVVQPQMSTWLKLRHVLYIKRNNGTDQICDFVFVSFLMMHLIISFRLKVANIEDANKGSKQLLNLLIMSHLHCVLLRSCDKISRMQLSRDITGPQADP